MHSHGILLFKSFNVVDYSPIARSFAHSLMDEATLDQTTKKFDKAYLMAKERLAFTKMKPLCEFEERNGGTITMYINNYISMLHLKS